MILMSRKLQIFLKCTVGVASLLSIVMLCYQITLSSYTSETIHNIATKVRYGNSSYFKIQKPDLSPKRLIVPRLSGRLGNVMFLYASMIGIARKNRLNPVFPANHYLHGIFKISAANYSTKGLSTWTKISETHSGYFEEKTQDLKDTHVDAVELVGYFQSWKYFEDFKATIFDEFTFLPHLYEFAVWQIARHIKETHGAGIVRSDVIVVGVHVRVSDLEEKVNIDKGYQFAPPEYLHRSIRYFEQQFQNRKLLFIICTDSHSWVRRNLKTDSPYVLAGYHSQGEDLAILSSCDHVIMTVGTYGWENHYLFK
ncbi:hypothetical protein CAPTEDRAFT_185958 [Capitella teleta]|uniref:L-Fucosyltransferase n=1 Tax=Capitella teleta TaxID=283909 RepID=R7T3N4_CAPTE|nr:hypothetical protein CAPTEDRAFT_185958 [Capitella teleta]|eukprot:ELT87246.1 hypothetical protein CAPTEDRAFT_185958 [Capitella teleta]